MFRFKKASVGFAITALILVFAGQPSVGFGVSVEELDQNVKEHETSFYREFFDHILYDQFANLLRFDRLRDRLTMSKHEALDINPYDEIPDSGFFVNRHGREHLSHEALKRGPNSGSGPDPAGQWKVLKGKVAGVSLGFFIEDQKGDRYLLKFDPKDNPEMATSAEMVSHKFFYAFGYNTAEYYSVDFNPSILTVAPGAKYYNEDGFKKPLTQEVLPELLDRVPKLKGGVVRASASKLLDSKGFTDFEGRRKSDPKDLIPHEDRRSLRALRVFGSWMNHYDLREGNTLDVVEAEAGEGVVKHYLFDFGSTLGSAASHPKVPAAGYEHIVDWFEVGKAAPTLKVVRKPWEKRWDEANREVAYPALGYFDNAEFDPGQWKTQLPYEVFNRLTPGDAFWATKIIMNFSDDDVRTIVETSEFSDPENARILSEVLIARRDIIGRYWFSHVTPLDDIRLFETGDGNYEIRAEDLAVHYGFAQSQDSRYRFRFKDQKGEWHEAGAPVFPFSISSSGEPAVVTLLIQASHGAQGDWSNPLLAVSLAQRSEGAPYEIVEIDHGL